MKDWLAAMLRLDPESDEEIDTPNEAIEEGSEAYTNGWLVLCLCSFIANVLHALCLCSFIANVLLADRSEESN